MDYEQLVKELRFACEDERYGGKYLYLSLINRAADAIEELSTYVQHMEELREDGWYLQKTKMMTCEQATMTAPLPEPPKENKL